MSTKKKKSNPYAKEYKGLDKTTKNRLSRLDINHTKKEGNKNNTFLYRRRFFALTKREQKQVAKLSSTQFKQYLDLRSRAYVTVKEYKELYKDIRVSKAKVSKINKKEEALKLPNVSTSLNWIRSREDFLRTRKRVKRSLQRGFKKGINENQRKNLYKNIRQFFNYKDAKFIIDQLKQLSDHDILKFFEENEDINSLLFDSDTQILDFIDTTREKFNNRLAIFKGQLTTDEAEDLSDSDPLDYDF